MFEVEKMRKSIIHLFSLEKFIKDIVIEGSLSVTIDNEEAYFIDIKEVVYKEYPIEKNNKDNNYIEENTIDNNVYKSLDGEPGTTNSKVKCEKKWQKPPDKYSKKKTRNVTNPDLTFDDVFERVNCHSHPFKCRICGRRFTPLQKTSTHHRMHQEGLNIQCDICGFMYPSKGELKTHQFIHNKSKLAFSCDTCGKKFKSGQKLKNHSYTHTGERPFMCSFCNKQFSAKENLNCHLRIHTGEKPYKCTHCDRSFSNRGGFLLHERTHTGEKPYQCETCGKRSISWNGWTKHKRTHTGETPFQCPICNRKFASKSNMRAHTARMHKVDSNTLMPLPQSSSTVIPSQPQSLLPTGASVSIQHQISAVQNTVTHNLHVPPPPQQLQQMTSINLQPSIITGYNVPTIDIGPLYVPDGRQVTHSIPQFLTHIPTLQSTDYRFPPT